MSVWHLDEEVARLTTGGGVVRIPPQPEGGYGVDAAGASGAFDVLADPLRRPRYGFLSRFEPDRDPTGAVELARRLHLNAVQFYDWMYRHAQLLPPADEFEDALGQHVSLSTVRRLAAALREAGAAPFGYAAVYAVGAEAWPEWADDGLYRATGEPWTLGENFLWNVDPTSERWLDHLCDQLRAARDTVGFVGFHLDQYGSPKRALRPDGALVDLSEAFPALIERATTSVPGAGLIFNNVNAFPLWATAAVPQTAVYIEVWPPHERFRHLAELIAEARKLAPGQGVILAAYLAPYEGDEAGALATERLQLATVFSFGGSPLLHGEEDAVLTEAYYVRHRRISRGALDTVRRYYDFAVRYGDLLHAPEAVDVTKTYFGGDNHEVRVDAPVPVSADCEPGSLWVRVVKLSDGLLISLIDLSGQNDDLWNRPKRPQEPLAGVRLRVERTGNVRILFAAPEESASLDSLPATVDGEHHAVEIPAFTVWALVLVRERAAA